jgi:hypothetical protein
MTPIEPRWYCVSALGVATLCADEQDARNEASSNDVQWDRHAPHRAVLLGDVAAERETIQRLREVMQRMVAGLDHLDKLTREWEPDHSSGADRRGWLLAVDARDDARALLDGKATG